MTYQPTDIDILWAKHMLKHVMDGGIMVFPSTGLVYKIEHKRKCLTLQNPEALLNPDSFITHHRTVQTFKAIGYTVEEGGDYVT